MDLEAELEKVYRSIQGDTLEAIALQAKVLDTIAKVRSTARRSLPKGPNRQEVGRAIDRVNGTKTTES